MIEARKIHKIGGRRGNHIAFLGHMPHFVEGQPYPESATYQIWGHKMRLPHGVIPGDLIEAEYAKSMVYFRVTEVRYEYDPRDQFSGKSELYCVVSKSSGAVLYERPERPKGIARRTMAAIGKWITRRA